MACSVRKIYVVCWITVAVRAVRIRREVVKMETYLMEVDMETTFNTYKSMKHGKVMVMILSGASRAGCRWVVIAFP